MDVSIKMILQIRGGQNAQKTEDILSIVDVCIRTEQHQKKIF